MIDSFLLKSRFLELSTELILASFFSDQMLKSGNKVKLSRADVMQKIGELFALR